jgi:hypothetical protein
VVLPCTDPLHFPSRSRPSLHHTNTKSHSDTTLAAWAPSFLYIDAVRFVRSVKKGPLAETSPMLCDIAATVPTWGRVNAGMVRMWQAECLGKLPIMQHFLFCGALPHTAGLEEAVEGGGKEE